MHAARQVRRYRGTSQPVREQRRIMWYSARICLHSTTAPCCDRRGWGMKCRLLFSTFKDILPQKEIGHRRNTEGEICQAPTCNNRSYFCRNTMRASPACKPNSPGRQQPPLSSDCTVRGRSVAYGCGRTLRSRMSGTFLQSPCLISPLRRVKR